MRNVRGIEGLPDEARRAIEELQQAIQRIPQMIADAVKNLPAPVAQLPDAKTLAAMLGGFFQPLTTGGQDPVLTGLGTGSVSSIDATSSASGFALSGGPITSSGTITFSISNTSNARGALGIGTIGTQNANNVAITGGAIDGTTLGATTRSSAKVTTLDANDDITISVAGKKFKIKEGSNASMGTATLVAGTVTVSDTLVTANSRIFLTPQNASGTVGSVYVSARVAGTSFTILSTDAGDTRDVAYLIIEPA